MLLSCVILLQTEKAATVPSDLGRAAHAWFLAQVERTDPALAERLHEASAMRPFTVSDLRGVERSPQGQIALQPGQEAWLRVTSLETGLSRLLAERMIPALEGRVELAGAAFTIKGATCDPALHPWAGQSSYEALTQEHLLGNREPARRWTLQFASPTLFKRTGGETALTDSQVRGYRVAGHQVVFPLPGLVFDSYLQRWNAYAPVSLHPDLKRYAEECVTIGRYRLQTMPVEYGEEWQQLGFSGQCQFVSLVHDSYWLRLMSLLAAFSLYAGTGAHTTMGMGQTRPETPGNRSRAAGSRSA